MEIEWCRVSKDDVHCLGWSAEQVNMFIYTDIYVHIYIYVYICMYSYAYM